MSLLNDALRDLERRQHQEQRTVPVSAQLATSSAPRGGSERWKWLAIGLMLILLVLVAFGGRQLWQAHSSVVTQANEALASAVPRPASVVPVKTATPEPVSTTTVVPPSPVSPSAASPKAEKAAAPAAPAEASAPRVVHRAKAKPERAKPVHHHVKAHKAKVVQEAKAAQVAQTTSRQPMAESVVPRTVPTPVATEAPKMPVSAGDSASDNGVIRPAQPTPAEEDQALSTRLQTLLDRGDDDGAVALFQRSAVGDQDWPHSRVTLVSGLLGGQRYQEVLTLLPASATTDSPKLRMLRARALMATSGPRSALALLKKDVPTLADWPDYYAMLATIYQQLGQSGNAATVWGKLLQLDNGRADWWAGLGIALDSEKRVVDAREAYRQALMLSDLNPPLRQYVAQRLSALSAQENE